VGNDSTTLEGRGWKREGTTIGNRSPCGETGQGEYGKNGWWASPLKERKNVNASPLGAGTGLVIVKEGGSSKNRENPVDEGTKEGKEGKNCSPKEREIKGRRCQTVTHQRRDGVEEPI